MSVIRMYQQMTTPERVHGNKRDFSETWLVELDDPLTPQMEIENHLDYPYQFQLHGTRQGFFVVKCNLAQDLEHPNIRKLTVDWANYTDQGQVVDNKLVTPNPDPTLRPLTIQWGTYKTTVPVVNCYERWCAGTGAEAYDRTSDSPDVDKKGTIKAPYEAPINTAGELIYLEEQVDFRVIQFSKNVRQLPMFMSKAGQFINSDTIRIRGVTFLPRSLLAADITVSDWQFENGIPYLIWTWNFYVDELHYGYIEKRNVGFNEKVIKYRDASGKDVPNLIPGATSYEVLRPIVVGPVDNRHYPSQPVLLRPSGVAIRTRAEGNNPLKPETWTGEVITPESRDDDARAQKDKDRDWRAARLKFRTKPLIPFAKYFPMQ